MAITRVDADKSRLTGLPAYLRFVDEQAQFFPMSELDSWQIQAEVEASAVLAQTIAQMTRRRK